MALRFWKEKILKESDQETHLTWKETISYAIGRGAQGMSTTMMSSSFLNFFMTNMIHLDTAVAGHIRLFCGLWDAANDPMLGVLVDKTRTKYGKMRPYIRIAPFLVAFFTLMFFVAPQMGATMGIVYTVIAFVGWDMAYTAVDVPMGALAFSITPNTQERTKLFGIGGLTRTILAGTVSVGMTIAMSLPMFKDDSRSVYTIFAVYASVMMIVLTRFTFHNTKERAVYSEESPSFGACLRLLFQNKPLLSLVISNLAFLLVTTIGASALYVAVDVLGGTKYMIMLEVALFPASIIVNLLVPKLMVKVSKRIDNRRMYLICCLVAIAIHGGLFFICFPSIKAGGVREGGVPVAILILILLGTFLFTLPQETKNLLQKEMEAETVDYVEWKTGERPEGVTLSIMSFLGKLCNSVSSSIVLYVLGAAHYVKPPAGVNSVPQTPTVRLAIFACVTLIPALGYLLMLIPMKFYPITGKKHAQMMEQIKARREAEGLAAGAEQTVDAVRE